MVLALIRGIIVGFIGGIPVGPVNAAVIDTAMRKCIRRAIAIGVGGAFVDFVYSQIATMGLGSLLPVSLCERVLPLAKLQVTRRATRLRL